MNPIHVLAFAADPLSAPPHGTKRRLLTDEETRLIREKLRVADFGDLVTFDTRWAARTDDLLQALNETHPAVVHFSGHGGNDGLILVGKDGRPHSVNGAALARLFTGFSPHVRVVVLSACLTLPQAQAIAEAVGCAIGTRDKISDDAAITFGASFYRAIAFGHSVRAAFDQASTALAIDGHGPPRRPRMPRVGGARGRRPCADFPAARPRTASCAGGPTRQASGGSYRPSLYNDAVPGADVRTLVGLGLRLRRSADQRGDIALAASRT